jgi:hypothetical protein
MTTSSEYTTRHGNMLAHVGCFACGGQASEHNKATEMTHVPVGAYIQRLATDSRHGGAAADSDANGWPAMRMCNGAW